MGIISSIVKTFTNDEKVSTAVKNYRLSLCNNCDYKNKKTNTCGPILIGKQIQYKGKQIQLCGCLLDEKSELKKQNCPINKW